MIIPPSLRFLKTLFFIDNLCQKFTPSSVSKRRHYQQSKMMNAEIITIVICGVVAGVHLENAWYPFIKRIFRQLFPDLCSPTRFNRTKRTLLHVTPKRKLILASKYMF